MEDNNKTLRKNLRDMVIIAEPYEVAQKSYKDLFLSKITPKLEEMYVAEYAKNKEEYDERIDELGVYFIVNHIRNIFFWKEEVRIGVIGPEKKFTISLDIKWDD